MTAQAVPLGEVAEIRNGFAFSSTDFRDVGVPVIRMSDLGEADVTTKNAARVDARFLKELPQFRIARGSLLIGMSGSIGKVAVYAATEPALQNQRVGLFCIKDDGALDSLYLRYLALTLEATLLRRGKGVAVKNVSAEDIEALPVPLPKVSEQKRIAAMLEKAHRLCRMRRYVRQLSDTFLQSVFLEMFGDPERNEHGFDVLTFEDIVESTQLGLVRGSSEMGDSLPFAYVRMDAILGNGDLNIEHVRRVNATPSEVRMFALKPGDFLFNTRNSRELVGKTALFVGDGTYLFNNNILRVRFKVSADPRYMIQLFQTDWMKQNLERMKSGTTNVFAIYYKDLRDVPVLLPPLPLQEKFAAIVQRFNRLRAQQREAERQAEYLFQTLLHRAFNGGTS